MAKKKQAKPATVISEREVRGVLDGEEYTITIELDDQQGPDAGDRVYIRNRNDNDNVVAIPIAVLDHVSDALMAFATEDDVRKAEVE